MKKRFEILPKNIHHLLIKTDESKKAFFCNQDYIFFIKLLKLFVKGKNVKLHGYCITKNEVELLIQLDPILMENFVKNITNLYEKYFEKQYKHKAEIPLFDTDYYLTTIDTPKTYLTSLQKILRKPELLHISLAYKYKWSSFGAYAGNSFVDTTHPLSYFKSKESFYSFITGVINNKFWITFIAEQRIRQNGKIIAYPTIQKSKKNYVSDVNRKYVLVSPYRFIQNDSYTNIHRNLLKTLLEQEKELMQPPFLYRIYKFW